MIDFTKPVQQRDGKPVRIICTDRLDYIYPIIGLVLCKNNAEILRTWDKFGRFNGGETPSYDLINVPQRHKHADVMIAYANDCSLEIEYKHDMDWHVVRTPSWNPNYEYRIKSR